MRKKHSGGLIVKVPYLSVPPLTTAPSSRTHQHSFSLAFYLSGSDKPQGLYACYPSIYKVLHHKSSLLPSLHSGLSSTVTSSKWTSMTMLAKVTCSTQPLFQYLILVQYWHLSQSEIILLTFLVLLIDYISNWEVNSLNSDM